ncbi:MAG: hypothetical protein ACXW3Z_15115 [Limisphaerales bacterium]
MRTWETVAPLQNPPSQSLTVPFNGTLEFGARGLFDAEEKGGF